MRQNTSEPNSTDSQSRASSELVSGIGDGEIRFREALVMWLRWNEAYEHATKHLFAAGQDSARLEDFMDSLDQLRREAISLSHSLLD